MNRKIGTVSFCLMTFWLSSGVASQTVSITVPLQVSGLPEAVKWFKVGCQLLTAEGVSAGWSEVDVTVDQATGRPMENNVVIQVAQEKPATRWKCSLLLPTSGLAGPGWKVPSENSDDALRPESGKPLMEVVSGELPASSPPIRNMPR